jgi:valyl-tRNA synthetase
LIEQYGTDALRYTLVKEVVGAGQDIRLDYNRKTDESTTVEAARNFANKLWNASRFVMMNLEGQTPQYLGVPEGDLELCDRWILARYSRVIQQTRQYLDHYGLGEAAKGLYDFIWGDFCDWYIELVKPRLSSADHPIARRVAQQTLALVLDGILKLLHPFMPHITEELWQTLTQVKGESCLALQPYPEVKVDWLDPALEQTFELLTATIRTIRNLRAEADIKPGVKTQVFLQSESDREREVLTAGQAYLQGLGKIEHLTITAALTEAVEPAIAGVVGTIQVLIPLAGVVDVQALRAKLEKDLGKVNAEIESLTARLRKPSFVDKAPTTIVQGARDALAEAQTQAGILQARLAQLVER